MMSLPYPPCRLIETDSIDELHGVIMSLVPDLQSKYGVLCFLYSVLINYGLESLRHGMADDADTLIDPVHGHASQCLINLLISGQATPYLFDGERNVSGITLTGILKQPRTGFLTLFEALHYCESGWYLKNPSYPIWILGSETHFTVLASPDPFLVCEETDIKSKGATLHQAEIEFTKLSTDQDTKAGFIRDSQLEELLKRLHISFTTISLGNLKKSLDPENLGVILESTFLQHFFPQEMAKRLTTVRQFHVIHYNGLEKSNSDGRVRYQTGEAHILDPTEDLIALEEIERSPIQRCLQTKWPTIRLRWDDGRTPSLN
ncbi:Ubiquitin carboxyl-terminal hydrolase MINDY-3 [Fasciola gigantica]|uniref:Ubiquitin carboxyl-terminal hydrolase MINDY n=1 Tax=Fasciola gigantica TaxID=46835 RepID=A0A504Y658_FASGI|nr:Ubiquitin carboxyl-terminal hydrolase MINDY-3 [Fasciola gigantica]